MHAQRSQLPLTLALVTFVLALFSGGYLYRQVLRTMPALVVLQDVSPGTELRAAMVAVKRLPAGGRPRQALYGPGQIAGMYAAVPLFADQVLTERHVTSQPPRPDPAAALTPAERIISLPVRPEAALGKALRPGDIVDVVAAWPGKEGEPARLHTLAEAVRVVDLLHTGGAAPPAGIAGVGPAPAGPSAVLLQVTHGQAQSLVAAAESKAALYFWLARRGEAL